MIIFFKLLLAHFIGDFIFQSDKWVAHKFQYRHKSKYLYFHSLLHGLLSWLLVFRLQFWPYVIAIIISHFLIDWMKLSFQKKENQKAWFFIDQILHLAILVVITWAYLDMWHFTIPPFTLQFWMILVGVTFLTTPSSILIKMMISTWTPVVGANDDSLQNAGKYIGILERLLIFTFILTQHWEGIGFLIAAKSIFRFGDLQESKDRKMTEYILIGTLLSFSLAVFTGLLLSISMV